MQLSRTKEEYLALLEDTVKYYSEDTSRRAMGENGCMYLTEDGKKCAVGRFLVKDFDYENLNEFNSVQDLYREYQGTDEFLIPEYRGYDISFWSSLQGLHDGNFYWDAEGLTEFGENTVERIKNQINEGYYCINH